jgi:hypothetical protein
MWQAPRVFYIGEDQMRFKQLTEALAGRADPAAEAEMGARFDERLTMALDTVLAGEEEIGLDTLCCNVCDYRVRLTHDEYDAIVVLVEEWRAASQYIPLLHELAQPR